MKGGIVQEPGIHSDCWKESYDSTEEEFVIIWVQDTVNNDLFCQIAQKVCKISLWKEII